VPATSMRAAGPRVRPVFVLAMGAALGLMAAGLPAAAAAELSVRDADAKALLAEIGKPGAKAVLVNVWATWCDPCRAEMPLLLAFAREHAARGLRLVLISADEEEDRDKAKTFLASLGVDFATWRKQGDDMTFIDALDRRWSGALPATFLFDGRARLRRSFYGEVTRAALDEAWKRHRPQRKEEKP